MIAENAPLILPLHQRPRPRCARRRRATARSAPPAAASARPTRTRSARRVDPRRRPRATRRRSRPGSTGCSRTTTRCAPASARAPIDRAELERRSWSRWRRRCCPTPRRSGRCWPRRAARASASCSRARRARCSTSTTAPTLTSPRRTRSPAWRPPAPAWAAAAVDFVLGIVKAYTTRVGEGPFPTELDRRDRRAARRARPRVRHRHRPPAPLRLVRRGAGAPDLHHRRRHRHRADQARRARRLRGAEDLRRLRARRRAARPPSRPPPRGQARGRRRSTRRCPAGGDTAGARSWAELPAQAIKYVRRIEELIGCPVALLSTSPERDDTILVTDPFAA